MFQFLSMIAINTYLILYFSLQFEKESKSPYSVSYLTHSVPIVSGESVFVIKARENSLRTCF